MCHPIVKTSSLTLTQLKLLEFDYVHIGNITLLFVNHKITC